MTDGDGAAGANRATRKRPGRRLSTIWMRDGGTPIVGASWGGTATAALALTSGGSDLSIAILDALDMPILALGPFEEDEVVATWRSLSAATGIPLAVLFPGGHVERPFRQLGRLRLGLPQRRRRVVSLNGRRPRFLVRRKGARLASRPLVYRECEMATGGGR